MSSCLFFKYMICDDDDIPYGVPLTVSDCIRCKEKLFVSQSVPTPARHQSFAWSLCIQKNYKNRIRIMNKQRQKKGDNQKAATVKTFSRVNIVSFNLAAYQSLNFSRHGQHPIRPFYHTAIPQSDNRVSKIGFCFIMLYHGLKTILT